MEFFILDGYYNLFMNRLVHIFVTGILFAGLLNGRLNAQDEKEFLSFRDRIFLGGNFGIQIGTITNIEISPVLGYYITPRLAGGLGARYEYYKDSRDFPGYFPFKTNIYGGSVFGRYMLIRNIREVTGFPLDSKIFTQAEYEILSLERKYFEVPPTLEEGRYALHSVLVGGGIFQPLGKKSGLVLMVLWNLNETSNSPYSNPIIREGLNF